jgi:alpha-galactosidase
MEQGGNGRQAWELRAEGVVCVPGALYGIRVDLPRAVMHGLEWRAYLADGSVLEPVHADFLLDGEGRRVCRTRLGDGSVVIHSTWEACQAGLRVRSRLENLRRSPIRLDHVMFETVEDRDCGLRLDGEWQDWAFFKMGWNVAGPSGFLPMRRREDDLAWRVPMGWVPAPLRCMLFNEGKSFHALPGEFESEWFTVLAAPDGASLALGFTGVERHFGRVLVKTGQYRFRLVHQLDRTRLEAGAARELNSAAILWRADPDQALRDFAAEVARENGARVRGARLWCSWYSGFLNRVDEAGLLANLEALAPHRGTLSHFQLDDGYQAALGDWLDTNPRFPSGLAAVAARIREAGFAPGLWTAPFAVSPRSRVFRQHRDWVVTGAGGRPLKAGWVMGRGGPRAYLALDTTRPDVLEHLARVYRELYDQGWRLFKLDFLSAAAMSGVRADWTATRAESYRRGLRAIREALPEDALLLAGISPILANAGLVDIQRLGPDTAFGKPRWRTRAQALLRDRCTPGLHNAAAASLVRSFTDGVLWSGDCDAILDQDLPPDEARLLATVNLLCGGTLTFGHDCRRGPLDLEACLRLPGEARGPVRVLDRLEHGLFPRHVALPLGVGQGAYLYGLINPTDQPVTMKPRLGDLVPGGEGMTASLTDFWEPGRAGPGAAGIEVAPRSARLLEVRFDRRP